MSVDLEREKVKRRIIALLNKTIENGASEQEAITAMEKAGELMEFYDVQYGELEFQEKNIVMQEFHCVKYGKEPILNWCMVNLAKFCQVRTWRNENSLSFCGFKHDVELAIHFTNLLEANFISRIKEYRNSSSYKAGKWDTNGKILIASFIRGMAHSISERFHDMAIERDSKIVPSKVGYLVPLKEAEIAGFLSEQGIRFVRKSSSARRNSEAFRKGKCVGDEISLNNPINGTTVSGVLR